jgi:hypothetical protein
MPTMLKLAITQKVSLVKDVLIQDLFGESVLLNLQSEEYFGQNEIGTRMLSVLKESQSIEVAYDTLLEEYEVEPEQLQQDLLNFVEKLVNYGLVEVTEA